MRLPAGAVRACLRLALLLMVAGVGMASARDVAVQPPPSEIFVSPNGRCQLEIAVHTPGAAGLSTGTLQCSGVGEPAARWQQVLPQPVRPKLALVANDGSVVLFGRWENVAGAWALQLLGPLGNALVTLALDDLARAAQVSPREVVQQSRHAVWLDRMPVLEGMQVRLGLAGRCLLLDLRTGALSRAPA